MAHCQSINATCLNLRCDAVRMRLPAQRSCNVHRRRAPRGAGPGVAGTTVHTGSPHTATGAGGVVCGPRGVRNVSSHAYVCAATEQSTFGSTNTYISFDRSGSNVLDGMAHRDTGPDQCLPPLGPRGRWEARHTTRRCSRAAGQRARCTAPLRTTALHGCTQHMQARINQYLLPHRSMINPSTPTNNQFHVPSSQISRPTSSRH